LTVHFDPNFTTPLLDNDISGYTCNIYGNCNGWTNFQTNFNVNLPPTVTGATISPKPANPGSIIQYSITASATDPNGGADIASQYAMVNYQGANAGAYRGYMGWSTNGFPYAIPDGALIACTGGGNASKLNSATYGGSYFSLVSCSSFVAGNTRTTTFVVTFNSSFATPLTTNTISSWAAD
jgi:hypothetical protein